MKPGEKEPPRPPAREGVIDLRFTCPKCNQTMVVEAIASNGLGRMTFAPVSCPTCNKITDRALPGAIVKIRRG